MTEKVSKERAELIKAERKLARLEKRLATTRGRIDVIRQALAEARTLHKEKQTAQPMTLLNPAP